MLNHIYVELYQNLMIYVDLLVTRDATVELFLEINSLKNFFRIEFDELNKLEILLIIEGNSIRIDSLIVQYHLD